MSGPLLVPAHVSEHNKLQSLADQFPYKLQPCADELYESLLVE